MRRISILGGGVLFACGLGVGLWVGVRVGLRAGKAGESPGSERPGAAKDARPPTLEELRNGWRSLSRLWSGDGGEDGPRGLRRRGKGEGGNDGELLGRDGWLHRSSRHDALLAVRAAVESGSGHDLRDALHALQESEGEPLAAEELAELGSLLATADRDVLHDLSRALAIAGGKEGLELVMGFLEDSSQPLERRRHALEGLSELPPERAGEAVSALAAFLEKGPPPDLERTATHAIGRLAREEGAATLLGLLESRPGIRAEAIFDALADVGRPGDAKSLLSLLSGPWSPGAKTSLLRAAAALEARGGDPQSLLGLLREPPPGVSREMVARALGDVSRDLGAGVLREALAETAGDRQAQEAIARALVWQGGKEGLEILMDAASSPDLKLDAKVLARALTEFQGEAAVPYMLDLFHASHDESILEPLARGLARNAGPEAMESLLGLLESGGDAWQRRALARALEEGSSAALGPDRLLELLHGEGDQEVASSLARAMSRLYPSALEGRATELFQSATTPVERVAFAQMLEKAGTPGAADLLGQQLQRETDSKAQWELARLLGKIGEEGVSRLADTLRTDADEGHRHSLLWGLEASHRPVAPEARALFVEFAGRDPSPSIRAQAAEILGRQGDPALVDVLGGILSAEQHPEVRARIERAIRELEGRR